MSGHSKWSTIKRQKGAADARRGNLFTKLSNVITLAAREGNSGDINFNFKLRLAVEKAKESNMPKENIQRAIDKGLGKGEGASLENATFEGFGPFGTAIIIEAITDNNNRTSGEVRTYFSKREANLGSPGSVSYLFTRLGEIEVGKAGMNFDQMFEKALEAEAEDVEETEESFLIYTKVEDLHKVKVKLESLGLLVRDAQITYRPNKETLVSLTDEQREEVANFLDGLSELDDVQEVYINS